MKRRSIVLSDQIDNEINQYINGTEFRNRSHCIESILKIWLAWRRGDAPKEQTTIFDIKPQTKAKPKK